ncbi:DUF4159 domain-containing protein [Myxococcota bacterium]|nr:DUF4159 domain-containing protein [Myxococcota bacterium]
MLGPSLAHARTEAISVGFALLKHGQGFDQRPTAIPQLMWEVSKRTSIDAHEQPMLIEISDPRLSHAPLLLWIGLGPCAPFSEAERARLSRHLRAGGLLFISDASPPGDDRFDAAARRAAQQLFPAHPLAPISPDHTLYRSFFLLDQPAGRIRRAAALEGVSFDDRSPILYERNDLFGAFGRDHLGAWLWPVEGGQRQRELAFRLGINLVMYATCLNYKRDQVHTTAILRRRRWRVESPPTETP